MGHQSYVLLCTGTALSNPLAVILKSCCDVHLWSSPWLGVRCSVRPGFAHCTMNSMNSDRSTAELFVLQFHSARGAEEVATNDWMISNHWNRQSNFEVTNTYLLSWIACCYAVKNSKGEIILQSYFMDKFLVVKVEDLMFKVHVF